MISNIFYVHPYLGKMSILTNIFQRGWFNHQLVIIWPDTDGIWPSTLRINRNHRRTGNVSQDLKQLQEIFVDGWNLARKPSANMGVSLNGGTPKWMVYNGKPYQNGWFGGTIILGNPHMYQNPVNNGIFTISTSTGFLNHQQYYLRCSGSTSLT